MKSSINRFGSSLKADFNQRKPFEVEGRLVLFEGESHPYCYYEQAQPPGETGRGTPRGTWNATESGGFQVTLSGQKREATRE